MDQESKDRIIHIINNVAQKLEWMSHMEKSIQKDIDSIWEIVNKD